MTDDKTTKADNSSGNVLPLIAHLNQYKEVILLIVFFLGGGFWMFEYFATKNQLEELQCLTNANVSVIESRMQAKFFSDELNEKGIELTKIYAKGALSENETAWLIKTRNAIDRLKDGQSKAEAQYDTNMEYIKRNYCSNKG